MNTRRLVFAALIFALGLMAALRPAWAERGDDANRKSKNGTLAGAIDGVALEVEYGRPAVRDRNIWGGLVPYDQVWRTGADEATAISFDRDVRIEGKALSAGRYALFTVPGMENWEVIFNNIPDQWGAFSHDPEEDALRVVVTPEMSDHVEELLFEIENEQVVLSWEKLRVAFRVAADG